MKLLELKNINKTIKSNKILENISFDIEKGKIYGLLGINGAGKSTIMKIICNLLKISSGEILFLGEKMKKSHLDNIGALIEYPPLYNNLSAYDNLKCKAILYGIENNRIEEVLKIVGLENTGKKKVSKFSLGMKQRLGIALAILHKPKLLILDEPTNGLDPVGIRELIQLIKNFAKDGTTILVSSHQISEIKKLTDRIIIINKGKVKFNGVCDFNEDLEEFFFKKIQGECANE